MRVKRALTSVRVKNFKAVHDSGVIRPGGLTVFIGDNGTGKSSVLEALRFAQALAQGTLAEALGAAKGFEHLRWKGARRAGLVIAKSPLEQFHPIELALRGHLRNQHGITATTYIRGHDNNKVGFDFERLQIPRLHLRRTLSGRVEGRSGVDSEWYPTGRDLASDRSLLRESSWFDDWQFVDMVPAGMGQPVMRVDTGGGVRLTADGRNLGEYLLDLRGQSVDAFRGVFEALQSILPYAREIEPRIAGGLTADVSIVLVEGGFEVPGWMLSSGTLRLLGLLALLRHPRPPTLVCIEEIENGLDPRTIHLVLREILAATEAGDTQVMLTTHSPYLLDLVPLESLVLVSRAQGESPTFTRPVESEEVKAWAKRFAPGQMYTAGTLHGRGTK